MNHAAPWLRTLAALAVTSSLAFSVSAQDRITYKVIGQPAATGKVQANKEKPFFDEFAKRTGLPIDADYKSNDQLGLKDTEQLRIMKAGLFDIVSLRVSQNSRDEPTLQQFHTCLSPCWVYQAAPSPGYCAACLGQLQAHQGPRDRLW